MAQEEENKNSKSGVNNTVATGGTIAAIVGLLTVFFSQGGVDLLKEVWKSVAQPSSHPTEVTPTPVTVLTPTPIVEPSHSPVPLTPTPAPPTPTTQTPEGKYSLAWAAQPGTQCYSGSIADLIISSDGFMQGYLANNSPDHIFSGKVNSDGTWLATLVGGYEFNGTLENGVLSGKYTAPSGVKQCEGAVRGFKQPS